MGEARKRRLALIKGGRAAEAKQHRPAPERLTNITCQMPTLKAQILVNIYETKVDKTSAPTLSDFVNLLLEAGMKSFEEYYLEINAPKPRDIEVPQQFELPMSDL